MKKIIRKTIKFLKHLLPVTWYRKLTNRQKLYVMTGVVAFLLVLIPSIIYSLSNATKSEAAWYDEGWGYRKQLTFNNSDQSTNLTNFPVMVKLTSSNFSFDQANEDGSDIRFTDSNGTTLLEYEIEEYNSTSQSAVIWVKVPQIDASSSTDNIYLYWGNSSASDAQNANNVWESNYKAVYHLNNNSESEYTLSDSTINSNHLSTKETSSKSYAASGNTGGSTSSPNWPNNISNRNDGFTKMYPSMQLDSNNYPVVAYHDNANYDLILLRCNDRECKGENESISVLDSAYTTGYYPSLQLDASGNPVIAYYDHTAGDLNFIHCDDPNCEGTETITALDTTNTTGYYPVMVLDSSGNPVIAYYDYTATDINLIHCDDPNCEGTETIQTIDSSTGTLGGYYNSFSLVLDSNDYPVISYYDATNQDLKLTHCNDANCSGGDETTTVVASDATNNIGRENSLQLDSNGYPMITYTDRTLYDLLYVHCSDANCSSTPTPVTITTATTYNFTMLKDLNGNPLITDAYSTSYPQLISCTDTNCSTLNSRYLSLYNQYAPTYSTMALDSDGYPVVAYQSDAKFSKGNEINIYTTNSRIKQAYNSDFDFATGSFTTSLWFKSATISANQYLLSRYDSDQGFKIWLDYAGRPCFGIDDDSSWGPDDSACATNSQIVTNVDNGRSSYTQYNSTKLDSNGYPVIAYYDSSGDDLEIVHCNDIDCSGGDEAYYQIDTTGDVGSYPSLQLDSLGYPVISYYDTTNQDLKIVHCGDANCSSGNVINTIDSTGSVGANNVLRLDTNGYPVIGYYDATNTAIKLIHCNDANCSGGDESIETVDNTEYDMPYYSVNWMELDANGYPVMAYLNYTNGRIKVAHCNDANCSGGDESIETLPSTQTGYWITLKLDSNGLPVIAFQNTSEKSLKLIKCNDVNCSNGDETLNTVVNNLYSGWPYIDIELDANNIPKILSTSYPNWAYLLSVCQNEYCSGENTNSLIRFNPLAYQYGSMELDASGYPVIAMGANGDLALLHMDNGTSYVDESAYDDGDWHHLVAVKDSTSSIKLYIDGIEVGSDTSTVADATLTSDSAELHLGENLATLGDYKYWLDTFGGQIDELQIDNTARSADWIKAQYLSESDNFITYETAPTKHSLTAINDSENLNNNLVAHWKLDEGYGNIAYNSASKSGYLNGTINSTLSYTNKWTNDGQVGKALIFNGTNRVDFDDVSDIELKPFTMMLWVKMENTTTDHDFVVKGRHHSAYPFVFWRDEYVGGGTEIGNTDCLTVVMNDGLGGVRTFVSTPTNSMNDTEWHHVAVSVDPYNEIKIYIDGIVKKQAVLANGGVANTDEVLRFATSDSNTYYLHGLMDEVKLFSTVLTENQVKQEYLKINSAVKMGSFSDTSNLTGGSVASDSASAIYCIPGDSATCSPPVGEWNFDEGIGTTVNDISGKANAATWYGTGNHWAVGKIEKAGVFNGTDDYTLCGTKSDLDMNDDFTLESWVMKKGTMGGNYGGIITKQVDGGNGYGLVVNNVNKLAFITFSSGSYSYTLADSEMTENIWYHVVGVRQSGTNYLYINGVKQTDQDIAAFTNATGTNCSHGRFYSETDNYYFNGLIDQTRIYNYARTPAQVAWDYNRGGPVAWWKFDECQGETAYDFSKNGHNGTLNIGATGSQTTIGTCSTPTDGTGAWYNGASGKYNYSINLDGTDDYINIPTINHDNLTWSVWIKTSSSTNQAIAGTNYGNAGTYWHGGIIVKSTGQAEMQIGYIDSQYRNVAGAKIVNDGNWHHVVFTSDTTGSKLYTDGVLDATSSYYVGQVTNTTHVSAIGVKKRPLATDFEYFQEQIDDVRIYNYALTPIQVKNVMNQGAAVRWGPNTGSP